MAVYDVTGAHPVFGHEPGSSFEAVIPKTQEQRLIASGAIARSEDAKPDKK